MVDIITKPDTPAKEPLQSRELPLTPPNPHKDGEYYDSCPVDGCIEVERQFKIGGHDGSNEHLLSSIYSADMRQGGCGALWSRDTRQGVEEFRRKNGGADPKWLTRSAQRTLSMPSDQFRANYDQIDWSKKPDPNRSLFEGG